MPTRLLVAILLLIWDSSTAPAHAQATRLCPESGAAVDSVAHRPTLVIRAAASAEEVSFRSEPEIDVRLTGCSVLDTVRVTERRNLPTPVVPGVLYRDVFIAVEVLGHLDAQCLLRGATPSPADSAGGAGGRSNGAVIPGICPATTADSIAPEPAP